MAAPTLAGLAAQLAALETKMDVLQSWADGIAALAAAREKRIVELEGFVARNAALIAGLSESDEASGWKKWREQKNAGPTR